MLSLFEHLKKKHRFKKIFHTSSIHISNNKGFSEVSQDSFPFPRVNERVKLDFGCQML